jgi:hypothetical protein
MKPATFGSRTSSKTLGIDAAQQEGLRDLYLSQE